MQLLHHPGLSERQWNPGRVAVSSHDLLDQLHLLPKATVGSKDPTCGVCNVRNDGMALELVVEDLLIGQVVRYAFIKQCSGDLLQDL